VTDSRSEKERGKDRIKSSILKNLFVEVELNITGERGMQLHRNQLQKLKKLLLKMA
jgi:hypothetical protein